MKLKLAFVFLIEILIISACNSQNNKLSGKWQLFGIDENGKASVIFNYILNLYGYDAEQDSDLLLARGDYLGAAIAQEQANNIKNNQMEIMSQMIGFFKQLGFYLIFEDSQIKMEIMGQRIVNTYEIRNNTIIIEQNGIKTESDFKIDGNKLFYDGFIWEKVNN